MFAALAPVFLAASALASPANLKRQDDAPAGCQGMSNGAWNIANFTLVAQYDSDASTQIPLALGGNGSTFTLGVSLSLLFGSYGESTATDMWNPLSSNYTDKR